MNLPDVLSLFSLPFMHRAILGGVLFGILGGILGSFLILRRLSLFGDTVGHSAMLGVVLAALLQLPSTWTLIGFTVAFGLGVIYLIDRTDLASDTVLCISLSGSVALGTIGFSYLKGYRGNLLSILFGDILAISNTDLILLLVLLAVTLAYLIISLPDQILLTLNSDLAIVKGVPVRRHRYFFIVLLAITIALTIRAVGILLVNGFLVIPAASARLICQQFVPFLATAAGMGAASGVMGMVISGAFDLPSGPSIVLVQLFGFLVVALCCRRG
ncbi:metal ABC transporter permease [Pleurocapsa sp. FMAR1]|uniref:metal ABC transporter permease n=1 Tax=Pleurocapsa sp. FMAR1 TaxID=3040204 RepID=UPI0029C742FD|nr:metal ABC transporter permease [Pleurocapsa sp. FMAR1]